MSVSAAYLLGRAKEASAMFHLLALPFILLGFLISSVFAAVGMALFSVFLIPLILLAVFFRLSFFFVKIVLVFTLGALLLVSCV
jgi:type III secretory pathway component EscR